MGQREDMKGWANEWGGKRDAAGWRSKQAAHRIGHPQHRAPEKRKYTQGCAPKGPQLKLVLVATFRKVF